MLYTRSIGNYKRKRARDARGKPLSSEQQRKYRYVMAKDQWLAFHPGATATEIEQAMLEIAKRHNI